MEEKWEKLPFDKKNVSKAGEISREIDAESKKYLKFLPKKVPKSAKPSHSDHVDIDVIKF